MMSLFGRLRISLGWLRRFSCNFFVDIWRYGIDSYELIKDHMNTEHTVEDIKAHLEYFVNKFAPQLALKSVEARSLITG